MSRQLIDRSEDLRRLRNDGYDIEVRATYLLLKNVPYVNARREIKFGTLVSSLTLAGDVTAKPDTHVALFQGEYPCDKDGAEIDPIRHGSGEQKLDEGLVVQHSFSCKPAGGYADYYHKMTTYASILTNPARAIDPSVTPKTFPVVEEDEEGSVFKYEDTASSRAGIRLVSRKLEMGQVAIVGLGGTGSYLLDLVAKTPVREIHLFDGDVFLQHNAFRSPGAPSVEELRQTPTKVEYFRERYCKMRRSIFAHPYFVDASNVDELRDMDFVFLCMDGGGDKGPIVEMLEGCGTPFIDVGMGVELVDGTLAGILRVTTSTPQKRDHLRKRVALSGGGRDDAYTQNIQIADLNALNATLAVIKWKKLCGFYMDLEKEHNSTYVISGNTAITEDQA